MLVQDLESQEDQYLFEICLVEYSVQIAIRLPFTVFPVFQTNLQLFPSRSLNIVLCLIGSDLQAKSTESQDAQNNQTSKSFHKHK